MDDLLLQADTASDAAGKAAAGAGSAIVFPPFRLDPRNERLWRGKHLIELRPKTFAVLRYLVERPGQLIRKEELLDHLWGDVSVNEAVLKTYLREIRVALGDSAKLPRFIETAHRRGYRFIGRVLEREAFALSARSAPARRHVCVPTQPVLAPERHAFVGREAELGQLRHALATALAGERRVMLVTGEPGIGKTTLVRAFLDGLRTQDAVAVAWGQCVDQYGAGEPYLPILEALRRLCRGSHRRQLSRALRRDAPSWLSHMPGLSGTEELAGARHPLPAPPDRMLCEMAELIEAFTQQHALVLWLEDLHWADHATLACVSYLARRSDPARFLLLCTYRPLEVAFGHPLGLIQPNLLVHGRCAELRLGFFSEAEVARYFSERFGEHRFPPDLLRLVHDRTGGSPLFMARVVDSWIDRQLLTRRGEHWRLGAPVEQLLRDTPASVLAMIECEIERLSPFERSVLEAASAAGTEFGAASVAAALEADLLVVEELCLLWARRRQFFRLEGISEWPDGTTHTRFAFIHAVYHQVAYERIGASRRVVLHRRIGAREEEGHGPRAREIASELAMHFERGQELSKAVTHRAAAGEQALWRSACKEAIVHYRRALELLCRLPTSPERAQRELALLVALGTALAMTRGHAASEVEEVYARARELCRQQRATTQHFQALMGVGAFYLVRGEYRTACALGDEFLAVAGESSDSGVSLQVSLLRGMSLIFLGQLSAARAELQRTIAAYDPELHQGHIFLYMQDPGVCAHSLVTLPLWIQGYPEQSLQHARQALSLGQRLAHPAAVVLGLLSLAQVELFLGDDAQALEHVQAGLALSSKNGFDLYHQTLTMLHGAALLKLSDPWQGTALIQDGWRALCSTGSELAGARWRSLLAHAYTLTGRAREALQLLTEGIARVQSHEDRWWEPELYRTLGDVLAQPEGSAIAEVEGQLATQQLPRSAAACFARALTLSRQMGAPAFELRAVTSWAALHQARGEPARGRELLAPACSAWREDLDTEDLRRARQLLVALDA